MSNRRKANGRVEGGNLVHVRNAHSVIMASHLAGGRFVDYRKKHFNLATRRSGRSVTKAGRLITACLWCGRSREVDKERICKACRARDRKRVKNSRRTES